MITYTPKTRHTTQTNTYILTPHQYVSDLPLTLPQYSYLDAPTGAGKTSFAVTCSLPVAMRVIFVPKKGIAEQLYTKWKGQVNAGLFTGDDKVIDEFTSVIFATYNQCETLESMLDAGNTFAFIDEAHHFTASASYLFRLKTMRELSDTLTSWFGYCFMSGTPLPTTTPTDHLTKIKVIKKKPPCRISWIKAGTYDDEGEFVPSLSSKLAHIAELAREGGNHFIYLNDTGRLRDSVVSKLHAATGIMPVTISSKEQDNEAALSIIEHEVMAKDAGITICTSVFEEGININTHVDSVHILSQIHPSQIQQFVSRFRVNSPDVYLYSSSTGNNKFLKVSLFQNDAENIAHKVAVAFSTNGHDPNNTDEAAIIRNKHDRFYMTHHKSLVRVVESAGIKMYSVCQHAIDNEVFRESIKFYNRNMPALINELWRYGHKYNGMVVYDGDLTTLQLSASKELKEVLTAHRELTFAESLAQVVAMGYESAKANENDATINPHVREVISGALYLCRQIGHGLYGWEAAIEMIAGTDGNTRRTNTAGRRIKAQVMKRANHRPTLAFYDAFSIGERYTPAQIHQIIISILASFPSLEVFADTYMPAYAMLPTCLMTERKGVMLLADLFSLKRGKVQNEDGTIENVWIIVDDCPACPVAVAVLDNVEGDFSLLSNYINKVTGKSEITRFIDLDLYALWFPRLTEWAEYLLNSRQKLRDSRKS